MLSFHEPHSLMAELILAGVALLVILYRVCGGSNEWLRTHGVILVTYYSFGGLAYDELEGWPLLDTTYFLTVTVTTVGYGDMCPVSLYASASKPRALERKPWRLERQREIRA